MVAPAVRPRGVRTLRRALVAASGALALLPAAAAAHLTGAHADGHGVSAKVRTVVGPGAVAADQGLYRVAPSVGEPVFTHGPDTRAALATREAPPATDGTGFSAGAVERRPACATDFYQRVIYVNPLGFPNRLAEATARIRGVVARMNAVLYSESLASGGGGAEMKFLCDDSGQVRVDSLTAGSLSFEGAVTAARAAGLSSDRANLLIFVDGTLGGSCGISSYQTDAVALDRQPQQRRRRLRARLRALLGDRGRDARERSHDGRRAAARPALDRHRRALQRGRRRDVLLTGRR